ncbi:MAG: Gfo/Idh/MocA family oxidoreductase [Phycisphaerales bacterium]|nr:Gfo/Idh/MocA family oxidoreductase [Phycisphaerales bacterium]
MTNERRTFLKTAALGAGIVVAGSIARAEAAQAAKLPEILEQVNKDSGTQAQNMCGFAAPPIKQVRVGIIGLGHRGRRAVTRMAKLKGATIVALCDLIPARAEQYKKSVVQLKQPEPKTFSGEDGWKALCEMEDIDLIYIATPWRHHTPMAVYAMECGKHAAVEVPAATTIEECWQLVNTSERTKKHCMQLENCCYDSFEMMTLNMARQGAFGELCHAEAAYIHELVTKNFDKKSYQGLWRLNQNMARNGNLYPTHGLGPVSQCMNINRGDQYGYLTSMSSIDVNMRQAGARLYGKDSKYGKHETYRGNMNTTMIKTTNGKTIMVQHDVSSPRPYSRIHLLSGSKGMCRKYPNEMVALGHKALEGRALVNLRKKYAHPLSKRMNPIAKTLGGHGGMDGIMDARLIECLQRGIPLDQDVYDAAAWSAVGPLSEWSVANESNSIRVPDFTRGAWKKNTPLAIVK